MRLIFNVMIYVYYIFRNFLSLKALVDLGADVNLKCYGTPPLHIVLGLAAMPNGLDFGSKSFSYLLQHADLTAKDDQVRCIHICITYTMYPYIRI